ncbi:hypothetical protein POJ06DRAFT_262817 [Lipomyces tetrasporus]|uniref:Uncharacterized protein n=1 Tax=Lipomyces tetrasporus TaxID=54092 RepID=A0AAD7QL18_9ASCO|nr:uncharacterized protein POJ06DRAFT_262817 [Lipomyces tetrasporus]KAJ8097234.1 hypothetical protein POJ06DRAFT_262817 [Lipomyces tetrasporus]
MMYELLHLIRSAAKRIGKLREQLLFVVFLATTSVPTAISAFLCSRLTVVEMREEIAKGPCVTICPRGTTMPTMSA